MAVQSDSYRTTQGARMSDFTPDEMMTLRVATRSYMESMRTNAITFTDDPDTGHYFASEAERAEELWNKLVRMDLESIRAVRKALADAVMQDDPDYSGSSDWEEDRAASDSLPHPADRLRDDLSQSDTNPEWRKRQYNDSPMHGPF